MDYGQINRIGLILVLLKLCFSDRNTSAKFVSWILETVKHLHNVNVDVTRSQL